MQAVAIRANACNGAHLTIPAHRDSVSSGAAVFSTRRPQGVGLRKGTLVSDDRDGDDQWPAGVARAEAPWLLRGDAFIVLTSSERATNLADAAILDELAGVYDNLFNAMLLADYRESPVGPFRELLYIPGRFRFSYDEDRMSITRLYANTEAGMLNRRANWGVPSQLAPISRTSAPGDREHFSIGTNGFAEFSFEVFGPDLPLNGKVIPEAFRSFGQLGRDRSLLYTLSITGTMRAARFLPHSFDADMFPDMAKRELVVSIKISDFLAEFPRVSTTPWTTA